jgi:protein-tyrosine kinase
LGTSSDASKKPKAVKGQALFTLASGTPVKTSAKTVDAPKLDIPAPKRIEGEPTFSRDGMDQRLASFLELNSVALQSFKMLRAKLFTNDSGTRPRSIMVTSPQPLDGKTTVAANLAISIAQGIGEYVMLVDCDLRKPSIDRLLGLKVNKGVREYLEVGTSVAPYLVKTPVEKLTLLTAGKPTQNPAELLSSEKMRLLVEELKARYEDRYVIFDATPAGFAAETTFLASMMDGVVLVVRSGKTEKDLILETIETIGRKKILGVVFNASKESQRHYHYYYRYYEKGKR